MLAATKCRFQGLRLSLERNKHQLITRGTYFVTILTYNLSDTRLVLAVGMFQTSNLTRHRVIAIKGSLQ